MEATPAARTLAISSHASTLEVTASAAHAAADAVQADLGSERPDLVLAFFGSSHVPHAELLGSIVRERLSPRCLVGVSAEGVIAGPSEFERAGSGLTLFAAVLPGARVVAFHTDDLPPPDDGDEAKAALAAAMGLQPNARGVLLFTEPASVALSQLVPAMGRAATNAGGVLLGGVASADRAVGNRLILNDRIVDAGGVGVTLDGGFVIDASVSQGTVPIGPNLLVTRARGGMIFELGGKPAIDAVRESLNELDGERKERLTGGLFIGRVVDEYRDRFGRGDFVMRKITGVRPEEGAIVLDDVFRTGQTVRLHVRDAKSAHEDLQMVMAQQQLKGRPAGGLLISCQSRGQRLFPVPNHDAEMVCRAFAPPTAGEARAKGGRAIEPGEPQTIPLGGFFASAEIGPSHGESHVHGQTAVLAMFRDVTEAAPSGWLP